MANTDNTTTLTETTVWYKSKRVWSAIITLISFTAYVLGKSPLLSDGQIGTITDGILLLTGSGGVLSTLIGVIFSSRKVTLTNQTNTTTTTTTE